MNRFFVILILLTSLLTCISYAQEVVVDLGKLSPQDAKTVLEAKAKAVAPDIVMNKADKYADVGVKVAKAISATAKELSINVNEFVRTPVGKWVMLAMMWKFILKDWFHIIFFPIFWAICIAILWKLLNKFYGTTYVMNEETKELEAKPNYDFYSRDARSGVAAILLIMAIAITIVCILAVVLV